jgi:hypothetical protein
MTGKHMVSLVAASLIFAGTAFAQQSLREPAGAGPGAARIHDAAGNDGAR